MHVFSRPAVLLIVLTSVLAHPARAQQSDEQAVTAVVTHFFDGMRARDTALLRSTVIPSAVLMRASGPSGLTDPMSVGQFIDRIGKGTGPGGDEQIKDPKVQIDGPLASLWTYYTFTPGGETKINHCGVDAFLLRKGPDGWKIFHIVDTSRSEGCTPIRP
jgi:ketosteroid isomerase-like protein